MNILELAILKKMVGGGGGSGTDNYNDLSNLPQINGETLAGNKSAENLGLQDALTFDSAPTEDSTNPVESGGVYNALAGKQDNLTFDGVYNASTNKAATESTVTNAIAGLDVSALSVDADETISSISETDGKISVTKQDIAIASNQVVAMTGYNKPSSAPATPEIQQSDTANAAIGKLEYKADVNQTNILLVQDATEELVDKGAKNIFDVQTPDYTRDTSIFPLSNGGITISCTNAIWTQYQKSVSVIPNKSYRFMIYVDSISEGLQNFDVLVSTNETTPVQLGKIENIHITGAYHIDLTSTIESINVSLFLNNTETAKTQSADIRVLLCSMAEWKISQNYAPFALPNYDLTQLEQQDRNSIQHLVYNGGGRNIFKLYDESLIKAQCGTLSVSVGDDYALTISGSDTNDHFASISEITPSKTGNYIFTSDDGDVNKCAAYIKIGDDYYWTFAGFASTIPMVAGASYTVVLRYMANTTGTYHFKFMMREADISDATYQPYALSNSDLTQLEAEDRAALAEVVDSGAKNRLDDIGWMNAVSISNGSKSLNNGAITLTASANDCFTYWTESSELPYPKDYKIPVTAGETIIMSWDYAAGNSQTNDKVIIFPNGAISGSVYTTANTKQLAYTVPANTTFLTFRVGVQTSGNSATYSNLMFTTKAAFGISKAFVPYRPNYDLVANSVWKYSELRYTNTATNEFQNTGVSFTVPANRAVEFYAYDRKDAAYLDSIVVCDSESNLSTRTTTIVSINRIESDGFTDSQYWTLQTTGIIPTYNAAVTYYVWVKRRSTGSNPVGLAYRFIT